ncbi:HEPN domain-containing protein [Herbaspirillum robiniae]|uniref:ApeA N-terminal domain 1-containing protein n=1 Tax=Herbaspirillum robiniae TaxID=2014887 RepID=UPI003D76C617
MAEKNIFEEQGHFWWADEPILPGNFAPENHVTGRFSIEENGTCHLELDGILPGEANRSARIFSGSRQHVPRAIQGITKLTGHRVLLIDAIPNGGAFNSSRFSYERYMATMCLVGKSPFPKRLSPLRFSRFDINFSGFEEWLQLGAIQASRTNRTLSLKSKNVKDIDFNIPIGKLTISHYNELPESGSLYLSQLTLKETNVISIKPNKAISPENVRSEFSALQDLMILLAETHYSLSWPMVRISRTKSEFKFYFRRITSSATAPRFYDMPTSFSQIHEKFGDIFSTWLDKRERFGAGFFAYISTHRDIELYAESRFMSLVQGLETYHRTKSPDSLENRKLQEKVSRIVGDIKLEKDKRWLQNMLRHAAEPRLNQRLVEIANNLPLGLDQNRVETFAQACATIRNDLAHFGGRTTRQESADYLREIVQKSDALDLLYQMTLWKEIGFDDDHLRQIFDGYGSYRRKHALVAAGLLPAEVLEDRHLKSMVSGEKK